MFKTDMEKQFTNIEKRIYDSIDIPTRCEHLVLGEKKPPGIAR